MQITFDTAADSLDDAIAALERLYGQAAPVPVTQGRLPLAAAAPVAPPAAPVAPPAPPAPPAPVAPPAAPVAPPPPAPPAAPVAPPAAPVAPPALEHDDAGIPWDARIHASTKSKTAEGLWRKKKGVEDSTVVAVLAEYGIEATPPPSATPPVPPPPPAPPAPVAPAFPPAGWTEHPSAPGYYYKGEDVKSEAELRAAAAPPPPPAVPAAPAAPAAPAGGITWAQVCAVMNEGFATGKITPTVLSTIAQEYGVTPFSMLATHSDKWAAIYDKLRKAMHG